MHFDALCMLWTVGPWSGLSCWENGLGLDLYNGTQLWITLLIGLTESLPSQYALRRNACKSSEN